MNIIKLFERLKWTPLAHDLLGRSTEPPVMVCIVGLDFFLSFRSYMTSLSLQKWAHYRGAGSSGAHRIFSRVNMVGCLPEKSHIYVDV